MDVTRRERASNLQTPINAKRGDEPRTGQPLGKIPSDIAAKFDAGTEIDDAMWDAAREALLFHRRIGNPIATWSDDGKVVWIAPEDISV